MTTRPIRLFGDPVLTSRASEVTEFGTDPLRTQVADMLETMDAAGGVGLAANQIGQLNRVFVFDTTHEPSGLRGHLINPVWRALGETEQCGPEGCLSIPDIAADTVRYETVVVSGRTVDGHPISLVASGLLSRCIQHESDHLDGVLFLSRLDADTKKLAMAEIRAAEWFQASTPGKDL